MAKSPLWEHRLPVTAVALSAHRLENFNMITIASNNKKEDDQKEIKNLHNILVYYHQQENITTLMTILYQKSLYIYVVHW